MVFRFRRILKILPGIRLNLSRSSISTSVVVRGAHITVGPHGRRCDFDDFILERSKNPRSRAGCPEEKNVSGRPRYSTTRRPPVTIL